MKQLIRRLLRWAWQRTTPRVSADLLAAQERIRSLELQRLSSVETREERYRADYFERVAELIEARQMAGAGPWQASPATLERTDTLIKEALGALTTPTVAGIPVRVREDNPITAQGAYGDIQLALQNVEWRREINLSWLEFSRWGIQQIILISRLHYIKNPIIRRLIDIAAIYPFARGCEVSSSDPDANEVLQDFLSANKQVLGQVALTELQRHKYYDGNLFFAFFPDKVSTGVVSVRSIDATEIQDIVTDPDDSDTPRFYKREWYQRILDETAGSVAPKHQTAWYPALGYEPAARPKTIANDPIMWDVPIWHRRCGGVSKWLFGCPMIYPALDWAKAARQFLEACATVKQALARIAMTLTTKGGQQAIEGAKSQLQTTVGPATSLWDENPPPVAGSTFVSGPGTTLSVFQSKGGGGDPEEVRQYKLMATMVVGVPETFLSDVSTGNLATATTLDRPTELVFIAQQEEWREDLAVIGQYVLKVSAIATRGKLRERLERKGCDLQKLVIMEALRERAPDGRMVYVRAAQQDKRSPDEIDVRVTFPAIREGDIPALVAAVVNAMTLGNKSGQVIGVDEREGVRKLGQLIGVEDVDEMVEALYPDGEYDADRTKEPLPAPIPKAQPIPGGQPQNPDGKQPKPVTAAEAVQRLTEALHKWYPVANGAAK